MEDKCSLSAVQPSSNPERWPWGWGCQSIWSSDLSVPFKSVHCLNFRNEEENIQSLWSSSTTSSYPAITLLFRILCIPKSGKECGFHGNLLLHSIRPMNSSVCLCSIIWYVVCLIWHSLFILTFLFIITDFAIFSSWNYSHSIASGIQIQISYWQAFSTLPKHCQEKKKKNRNSELSSLYHSEECRTLGECAHWHQPRLTIKTSLLPPPCHRGHEAMTNARFL